MLIIQKLEPHGRCPGHVLHALKLSLCRYEVKKLEKPKFKQLLKLGEKTRSFYDREVALEIREYDPYVVAEVSSRTAPLMDITKPSRLMDMSVTWAGHCRDREHA